MSQAAGSSGKLLAGRILCAGGIVLALVGAYFVSIGTGVVGILLGAIGYYLGARNLGRVTIILCVLAIFVSLLAGQGVMPGAYDNVVNGAR